MDRIQAEQEMKIGDLARLADVKNRTIHYYVARGLLDPPKGSGGGAVYTKEHLEKLLLVRQLTMQQVPLDDIKLKLQSLSPHEIRSMLTEQTDSVNAKVNAIVAQPAAPVQEPVIYTAGTSLPSDVQDQGLFRKLKLPFGMELIYPADRPEAVMLMHKVKEYIEFIQSKR